jgi:hypothetical protein
VPTPDWRTLLVYSWVFPDLAPRWIVTNESIARRVSGGAARSCPPLLESVDRARRGDKVGVYTHDSGRGIGFMLEGTEQHGERDRGGGGCGKRPPLTGNHHRSSLPLAPALEARAAQRDRDWKLHALDRHCAGALRGRLCRLLGPAAV